MEVNEISHQDKSAFAHEFLEKFLNNYHKAKRGGIHDVIEISIYKMINNAVGNIDVYLKDGHKEVKANELMHIVFDSFQKELDVSKRNLETMKEVNLR